MERCPAQESLLGERSPEDHGIARGLRVGLRRGPAASGRFQPIFSVFVQNSGGVEYAFQEVVYPDVFIGGVYLVVGEGNPGRRYGQAQTSAM